MQEATQRLLRRVSLRRRVVSAGERFHGVFLLLALAYVLLLLCSRLLGVLPNWFHPLTLVTLLAAALALALVLYRRPTTAEAARLVDHRMRTEDLFLTAALIGSSAGKYQELVLQRAEQRAPSIPPRQVAPFRCWRGLRNVALALGVLLVAGLFLPQLDPFGRQEQREKLARQRKHLAAMRKATAMRKVLLARKRTDSDLSEQVKKAVGELKQVLDAARPENNKANLKRLTQKQAQLGELWRKLSERRLKDAFRRTGPVQRFGGGDDPVTAKWRRDLQNGNPGSLQKSIRQLKASAGRLAETSDPLERQKLAEEIRRKLKEMKKFAERGGNCRSLCSALGRACGQLSAAGNEGLSGDALQGLQESLDLAALEVGALGQSIRDLQALEEGLQTAQLAKLLSRLGELDGEASSSCSGIGEYRELYGELMEGRCRKCGGTRGVGGTCGCVGGTGPLGGIGVGRGGRAPEDDSLETDFTTERSRSALTAGKVLLSVKTRGISPAGEAVGQYQEYLRDVKEGVSEAILREQIPPSYHDAVRQYFSTMELEHGEGEAEGP